MSCNIQRIEKYTIYSIIDNEKKQLKEFENFNDMLEKFSTLIIGNADKDNYYTWDKKVSYIKTELETNNIYNDLIDNSKTLKQFVFRFMYKYYNETDVSDNDTIRYTTFDLLEKYLCIDNIGVIRRLLYKYTDDINYYISLYKDKYMEYVEPCIKDKNICEYNVIHAMQFIWWEQNYHQPNLVFYSDDYKEFLETHMELSEV